MDRQVIERIRSDHVKSQWGNHCTTCIEGNDRHGALQYVEWPCDAALLLLAFDEMCITQALTGLTPPSAPASPSTLPARQG